MTEPVPAHLDWALAQLPQDTYRTTLVCQTRYSAVWRLSARKTYYLKHCPPALARESAVIAQLATSRGQATMPCLPELVASAKDIGCFLLADAGTPVRAYIRECGDITPLQRAVATYAQLQIDSQRQWQSLHALGVPDWQPELLPQKFRELLADEVYVNNVSDIPAAKLAKVQTDIERACASLVALPIPASIEHADFHDNNILFSSSGVCVIDWGEAVYTHPFFSLHNLLFSASVQHGWEDDHPARARLRSAYLLPWLEAYTDADVTHALTLTAQLALPYKALCYQQLARACGPEGAFYWMRNILPLIKQLSTQDG